MHFRNVLFLGLLAVREHRHSHCCQERLLSDVLHHCTWGSGRWGAEPLWPAADSEIHTLAFPTIGAGNSPDSRRAPGHSMHGPREGREATGPPGPSTLLPWLLVLAQAVLASTSAKAKFPPVHAGNQRLFPITYSLAFHFKITGFFFPQVYICTKTTTRFKLQQLMKFNYINSERAF